MQIRELPRGGQYSLKGNVINVPVDIQPTVSCLPRPMDENFTIALQLKKKLSNKKVDFKENVRPLRVLTALHWRVNKSELYKRSGVEIDVNWFKEVTESSEETVREFLEVSNKQNKEKHKQNRTNEEDVNASSVTKDSTAADDYDSDHFSEIDTKEQVGNVDTLLMMKILKTNVIMLSVLHLEKDSILLVYIMMQMQSIFAFLQYFVVRGVLVKKKELFQFIIVTLLSGN